VAAGSGFCQLFTRVIQLLKPRSGAVPASRSPGRFYTRPVSPAAVPASLRRRLLARLARNAAIVTGLIAAALAVGAAGYHWLDGLPWLDAALNVAMILTGIGPVSPWTNPAAKVFAIAYALAAACSSSAWSRCCWRRASSTCCTASTSSSTKNGAGPTPTTTGRDS
jgi:hypothetical protein